jgi:hypothetical protein
VSCMGKTRNVYIIKKKHIWSKNGICGIYISPPPIFLSEIQSKAHKKIFCNEKCVHESPHFALQVYHSMVRPQVVDGGDSLQIWRVAGNILNKQS